MPTSGTLKERDNTMKKLVIPVVIFLCFAGLYYGIALFSGDNAFFKPVWDIQHYVNISETGYEVHPCTHYDYPPGEVCGNVGWYPGWPLVMKSFRPLFGGSSKATYIVLAALFALAGFILLYRFVEKMSGRAAAIFATVALAGSPAGFYLLTGFPYALFLFLFMLYIHLFYYGNGSIRDAVLVIMAIALTLTYPTGILFALIPFTSSIAGHMGSKRLSFNLKSVGRAIIVGVLPFVFGLLMLWVYFYFRFDNFFVQMDFQARYQRVWSFPLTVIYKSLINYPVTSPENLVLIWYGLALIIFAPYKIKVELWVLAIALYLFSPGTGTTMSIYRHFLAIFPIYMLAGVSSRPRWLKATFIALGLGISLIWLFPTYLEFKLI